MAHDARASAHRHEHALEADQAAGRDAVFKAHAALAVGSHVLEVAAAAAELFHDGALMLFLNVNRKEFIGFHLDAVDFLQDDARTRHGEFIALAAHVLKKNCEVEFAAAGDFPDGFVLGRTHAHGDVRLQFTLKALADLARGHELAFAAGERGGVHLEVHREGGFVHLQHWESLGLILVGDGRANVEFLNAGDEDDVARLSFIDFLALQTLELKNRIDLGTTGRVVGTIHDRDF